jgi:excisionase family DNA binding protein
MKAQPASSRLPVPSATLPQLLTPDQVAQWLGTSRKAIYARLERGQLARNAVVRIGRRLYFRGDALLVWLEQQGRVP